jgi:hypothetical protein
MVLRLVCAEVREFDGARDVMAAWAVYCVVLVEALNTRAAEVHSFVVDVHTVVAEARTVAVEVHIVVVAAHIAVEEVHTVAAEGNVTKVHVTDLLQLADCGQLHEGLTWSLLIPKEVVAAAVGGS